MNKPWLIATIVGLLFLAAGVGVLVWWLVTPSDPYSVINLDGSFGDVEQRAGYTRIKNAGDMFWWFYPVDASRPILIWLDGVTGLPPSLLANIGIFGPYDINMNKRSDSWVNDYNLLFIDAPLGTGYSVINQDTPKNIEVTAEHLELTLESFISQYEEYSKSSIYIFGQGHGAQLAVALATKLHQDDHEIFANLKGVVLANGIISPATVMTKLGFYMEELGFLNDVGRSVLENLANKTNDLVQNGDLSEAYDNFLSLDKVVNEEAGAIAINLGYVLEKATRLINTENLSLRTALELMGLQDGYNVMKNVVAPALGIDSSTDYDQQRNDVIEAFRESFMVPATDKVEYLLQNTNLNVTIYNGNLDAISNTPGQLDWVEGLQWSGQSEFLSRPREYLVVDGLLQGYFRESTRLQFYWMNAAGQSDSRRYLKSCQDHVVENADFHETTGHTNLAKQPEVSYDSPMAMRRVLSRIGGY